MLAPTAAPDLVQALDFVDEFGPICELMYLMMAADRRIKNVEREVLRGALEILSDDRVRTGHMDAMLDASARCVARQGADACFARAVARLHEDSATAETTLVLAAAVAAADGVISDEESALLQRLGDALEIESARAADLIAQVVGSRS